MNINELKAAIEAILDDADDTGCEFMATVSSEVLNRAAEVIGSDIRFHTYDDDEET